MAKTHPSYTVDTTFSGKNISSAASVYQFTASASAKVQFIVKLTNAAGNGDYIVYLSHQWLGSGSAATVLPKTTASAASGETVIEFITTEVNVKATDVVDVMVKGLAGDTSVNGNIRIIADNPSVFEATDGATLDSNAITANVLASDAVAEIADGVWDEVLSGHTTVGSAGKALGDAAAGSTLTPADIWGYSVRTLTQTNVTTVSPFDGSRIYILRGDTLEINFTGLGDISTYTNIDFTIKNNPKDDDDKAILRIRNNKDGSGDGLLIVNGSSAFNPMLGSIGTSNLTLGNIEIYLSEEITRYLVPANDLYYDIQIITSAYTKTLVQGYCDILPDITRSIT